MSSLFTQAEQTAASNTLGIEISSLSFSESWGSSVPGFREKIRVSLSKSLIASGAASDAADRLLTPGCLDQINGFAWSISHGPALGGFIITRTTDHNYRAVGLDIEPVNRVTSSALARVSQPNEDQFRVDPGVCWTAKESAFKCFSFHAHKARNPAPQLLVDLRLRDLKNTSANSWLVRASYNSTDVNVAIFLTKDHFVAISNLSA